MGGGSWISWVSWVSWGQLGGSWGQFSGQLGGSWGAGMSGVNVEPVAVCDCVHPCMCMCACVRTCVTVRAHACACMRASVRVCVCEGPGRIGGVTVLGDVTSALVIERECSLSRNRWGGGCGLSRSHTQPPLIPPPPTTHMSPGLSRGPPPPPNMSPGLSRDPPPTHTHSHVAWPKP